MTQFVEVGLDGVAPRLSGFDSMLQRDLLVYPTIHPSSLSLLYLPYLLLYIRKHTQESCLTYLNTPEYPTPRLVSETH
jgi:hypothetical protein